ncbi:MAG: hypothetical protein Q7U04_05120 [Bacteriovorax sp.]|nr:hypothetical protein [Bacteriovorax sp.]
MKTFNFLKKHFILLAVLFFLFIANTINQKFSKPLVILSKQSDTWNLNDEMVLRFNLGFKRLESSYLWISTILESDIEHYKDKNLNSWMFLRFNSISKLDPQFYENYAFGGPYLSIVKDDLEGASVIYDKGLLQFPNDFSLLRDAGFHYHFELGNYSKSYAIYSRLKNHKLSNPVIISNLARLEIEKGNPQLAFNLLLTQLKSIKDKDSFLAQKIKSHLYSIKAEMDLTCLNMFLKNCSVKDFYGKKYIYKNNIFAAAYNWQPYRLHIAKKRVSP